MRVSKEAATGLFINRQIIKNNLDIIKKLSPYRLISVLKSDAYGLGINNILPFIINDVYKVIINSIEEFFDFKLNSYNIDFIILFPELDRELIQSVLIYPNVQINLNSIEMLKILASYKDKKIKIYLEVDSGMNRTGIRYDSKLELPDNLHIVGLFTHLKNYDIYDNVHQICNFYDFIKLNNIDIKGKDISIFSSSGLINYNKLKNYDNKKVNFILQVANSVRTGILQYGIAPSVEFVNLVKDMGFICALRNRIGFLGTKNVNKNETIGYTNNEYSLTSESLKIGLAYIGYSKIPFVKKILFEVVTNKRKFITESIGSLSMDVVAFNLNSLKEDEEVKELYLFSNDLRVEYQAKINNLPVYNFLTSLKSVKKYIYGGDEIYRSIE